MNTRVGVLAYGAGNAGSIASMIEYLGGEPIVVSTAAHLTRVDRVILPGVGHFDHGVRRLKERGLFDALKEWAAQQRPLMGICLGMQLLFAASEEGCEPGLDLVPGRVIRLAQSSPALKIPHMGWNTVDPVGDTAALRHQIEGSRYYFVHSFHCSPVDRSHWAGVTTYGQEFCSAIDNGCGIVGYQFHPEKSHRFGMALVKSFLEV